MKVFAVLGRPLCMNLALDGFIEAACLEAEVAGSVIMSVCIGHTDWNCYHLRRGKLSALRRLGLDSDWRETNSQPSASYGSQVGMDSH